MQATSTNGGDAAASLKAGHFLVVRSIMRVLPGSLLAKATVDAVIDAASDMQNLRTVIADYRDRVLAEPREDKRKTTLGVCVVRTSQLPRLPHIAQAVASKPIRSHAFLPQRFEHVRGPSSPVSVPR